MQVKEEPIEIISGDEADIEQMNDEDEAGSGNEIQANAGVVDNVQETDGVDYHHFEKNVTTALASIERPQVLHFPNQISKRVFKRKYLRMTLEDVETHKTYNCKVRTAGRRNAEKSLGGEWFDFVIDRGLQENDLLIFDLEDPPTKMYVKHIRVQ